MARQSYLYTDFSLSALKDKVQEKSGIQVVNMSSCNELAALLATHDLHISGHTLARFFRVIANSNMPSQYTLDQLASFVGYNSWCDFHKQSTNGFKEHSNGSPNITKTDLSDSELSLIRFCLQDGAYIPLQNYFSTNRDIFCNPFCPKSQGILKTLTEALNTNPKVRPWLFSYMLKDNFIGGTYFGHEINVDAISSYYGDAVDKYFLKLIHPSDSIYSSQIAWAHAIIMMQAFYQGDKKKLLQHGYELFKLSPPEENTLEHHLKNGQTFIWVFARYHFVHILYLNFANKANARKIEQKVKQIAQQLSNATQLQKIITYSLLFEALTHIGYSHLIYWFTTDYTTIVNHLDSPIRTEGLKALVAVIFFYTMAMLPQITNTNKSAISKLISQVNSTKGTNQKFYLFGRTYNIYLQSLQAILTDDPKLRQQYLADAREHAQRINNKYFIEQVDRLLG